MFRKDLVALLLDHPMSVDQIARLMDEPPASVADDVRHIARSLKHSPYRTVVTPARCRHCGFAFHRDKLLRPGKCPVCHRSWIDEPRVAVERR